MLVGRLAAVLLGAGLGAVVLHLPVFAVSAVDVAGIERIAREPLLHRLALEGRNILTLPVEQTIDLLKEDPWIRSAHIKRQLPGTVQVAIQERAPAALWQVDARFFAVDRDGTVLEEVRSAVSSLPLIKDLDGSLPQPGEQVDVQAIAAAVRLADLLPREFGEAARSFEYLSYGGLVVETDKGRRARFGDDTDIPWKIGVWKAVLAEAEVRKLKAGHVDLRFGDRPFFRPQ